MSFEESVFAHEFKLNDTDDSIIEYIKKHRYKLSGVSIHKMASELFVSPNAIMRTAKKLGYSGFSELKFALQSEYSSEKSQSPYENIIEKIPLNILKTLDVLDENLLDKLVQELLFANKILIVGDDEFSFYCKKLCKGIRTVNKKVDYFSQNERVSYAVRNSSAEDLIIICDCGKNHKAIDIANYAKGKKIPIFCITDTGDDELNKICEHHLFYFAERKIINKTEMIDRIGLMIIIKKICDRYWFKFTHK